MLREYSKASRYAYDSDDSDDYWFLMAGTSSREQPKSLFAMCKTGTALPSSQHAAKYVIDYVKGIAAYSEYQREAAETTPPGLDLFASVKASLADYNTVLKTSGELCQGLKLSPCNMVVVFPDGVVADPSVTCTSQFEAFPHRSTDNDKALREAFAALLTYAPVPDEPAEKDIGPRSRRFL